MIVQDLRYGSKAIVRIYRNGVIIWEVGKIYTLAQFMSDLTGFSDVDTDYPVSVQMSTDGQLGVKGTPNAQNVANLTVGTGEFGGNVTAESADGINTIGTAEMKIAVCGRPTNGSIAYMRATDELALGLFGSAEPADTVDTSGRTDLVSTQRGTPDKQGVEIVLFSAKGELNENVAPQTADAAEQVNSYASGNLIVCGIARTWLDPVVENGVLILRQVHTATLKDGILEVR